MPHLNVGEDNNLSPSRNNLLEADPGKTVIAGNTERAPSLDVPGVRTRNQRNRDRSGKGSPFPALP